MSSEAFKPEPWMQDALCAQTDPELFFPELGGSTHAAKAICAKCPVRAACLAFAVEHVEYGVWGGTSDKQRTALRRKEVA